MICCEVQNTRSSRPNEDVVTIELVIKPSLSYVYDILALSRFSSETHQFPLYGLAHAMFVLCIYTYYTLIQSLKKE